MSTEDAAELISPGANVGMSGLTGAGYPKEVPGALAARISEANARGDRFAISVWAGASTAPEIDGVLATVDGIELRMPYQSDPVTRAKINAGLMDYLDVHLPHVAQMVWEGFFGHLDLALIEVAGVTAGGELIPSSSVGNNMTWIDQADRVILEVSSRQPAELDGMHDIYYGTALPPSRKPLQITHPADRIGEPYLRCPPEKIIAIVETDSPDRNTAFKAPDADSKLIADAGPAAFGDDDVRLRHRRLAQPGRDGRARGQPDRLSRADRAATAGDQQPSGGHPPARFSCIVPMASHVDHTEHDVHVIVTEQGLADLRGLPPRRRAQTIIDNCAHPDYRPALQDYFDRAVATSIGKHTPHLLSEALSWHARYLDGGSMRR